MFGGQRTLFGVLLPVVLIAWARAAEPLIGLPAWGNRPWGIGLTAFGLALLAGGLFSRELTRWLPRPVHTGFSVVAFGVSMIAASRAGMWLVAPAIALGAVALAMGERRSTRPLLPPADDAEPTLDERVRFWFIAGLPWVVLYEFTSHMRLPGQAFRFDFEDQLPVWPITSLLYQSIYLAVTVAPFLARTNRELRTLTLSVWVSSAVIFPFYWLVPTTGPQRDIPGTHVLAKLLSFEHRTYAPSAAFPSFHVLWAIFVGRLFRPAWVRWAFVLTVSISCITTGMHYIPDLLAAFVVAPIFLEPRRLLWNPLKQFGESLGIGPDQLGWALAHASMVPILLSMWWRATPPALMAGSGLMGAGLLLFAAQGRRGGAQWVAATAALGGALLTALG